MKVGLWGSDTFGRGHIPPGSNVMRVSVMREGVAHERYQVAVEQLEKNGGENLRMNLSGRREQSARSQH